MQFRALKPFRRKKPGEIFEAAPRHRRALEATGLAEVYTPPPPPPPPEVDALRASAEAAGIAYDRRWGKARLEQAIEEAEAEKPAEPESGRYQRRDMRAEDSD